MFEVVTKTKKWGSSLGVIIPKEVADKMGLKEESEIVMKLAMPHKSDALQKTWGLCKDEKRSAQEIKDELRRTLWSKEY